MCKTADNLSSVKPFSKLMVFKINLSYRNKTINVRYLCTQKGLKYLFKVLFNMHFLAGTVKRFKNSEGHCSAVTAFNA